MEEILKLMDELKETTTDKSKLSEMETQNQELAKQIKTLEDRKSLSLSRIEKQDINEQINNLRQEYDKNSEDSKTKKVALIEKVDTKKELLRKTIQEKLDFFDSEDKLHKQLEKEIPLLESQAKAYQKVLENAKRTLEVVKEEIISGKLTRADKVVALQEEINANQKHFDESNKELEKAKTNLAQHEALDKHKEEYIDLEYLFARIQRIHYDNVEEIEKDDFYKKYKKEVEIDQTVSTQPETSAGQNPAPQQTNTNAGQNPAPQQTNTNAGQNPAPQQTNTSAGQNSAPQQTNTNVGQNPAPQQTNTTTGQNTTPQSNSKNIIEIKVGRKVKIGDKEYDVRDLFKNRIPSLYKDSEKYITEYKSPEMIKNIFRSNKEALNDMKEKLNTVDPSIIYILKENKILDDKKLQDVILAMANKDKTELNKILKITYDKDDLSKGAFLPWNKKQRDLMLKYADKNKEISTQLGVYEPNPFKRLMNKIKPKRLGAGKEEVDEVIVGEAVETKKSVDDFRDRLASKVEIAPEKSKDTTDNEVKKDEKDEELSR